MSEDLATYKAAAHTNLAHGNFQDAVQIAQDAIQLIKKPVSGEAQVALLVFFYIIQVEARMRLGDIAQAEHDLLHSCKPLISSLSTASPLVHSYLFDSIQLSLCKKRYDDALQQLNDLIVSYKGLSSMTDTQRLKLARALVMQGHTFACVNRFTDSFQALAEARTIQEALGRTCEAALTLAHEVSSRLLSGDSTNCVEDLVVSCEEILAANPSWPGLPSIYHNIAVILNCEGRSQDAVDFLAKSANLAKVFFGDSSTNYTRELLSLAQTELIIGNVDEARKLVDTLSEKRIPANDGHLLFLRGDLAYFSNNFEDAIRFYRDATTALKHDGFSLLANDAEQALASCLQSAGYGKDSLVLLDRLAARYEKSFGDGSPRTSSVYVSLANVFRQQGRFKEAMMLYDKALTSFEVNYGRNHAFVATVKVNIAGVYISQGNYRTALTYLSHARAIRDSCFGGDHPLTIRVYLATAKAFEALFIENNPVYREAQSSQNPNINPHEDKVNYEDALYFYEKALQGSFAVYGDESAEVIEIRRCIVELKRRKRVW